MTIKELAEELQVSPAAISLALNGKPGVSDAVRQRIIDKAKEYNYTPSRASYNSKKHLTIRFIVYKRQFPDSVIRNISFYSLVLEGLEDAAKTQGYNILVSHLQEGPDEIQLLTELQSGVDGIIFFGTEFDEDSPLCSELVRIDREICPVTVLDTRLRNTPLDCFTNDNFGGACSAVEYLLAAGHRRIGYFTSSMRAARNFDERSAGVTSAIAACPGAELVSVPMRFSTKEAHDAVCAWAKDQPADTLPTAFFADSDILAFGAIQAFSHLGLRVPDDISVLGYDDMPECELFLPALSTIHVAKRTMGREALLLMSRRIRERQNAADNTLWHPPLNVTVKTFLKERSSVRPLYTKS
ncbi:MAG: LacI family transcriptional regulator [Eubacterium sp.]|nr:LacI family transcriptional regulator [Eubacterium sp.]